MPDKVKSPLPSPLFMALLALPLTVASNTAAAAIDENTLNRCFSAHSSVGESIARLYLIREDYPGPSGADALINYDIKYSDGWGFKTTDKNDAQGRYIDHYFADDEGFEAVQFTYTADGIDYKGQSDEDRYSGTLPAKPSNEPFEFMGDKVAVSTAADGCYVTITFPEGGGELNWIDRDGHLRRITQIDDPQDMEHFQYNQVYGLTEPSGTGVTNEYEKTDGRVTKRTTYRDGDLDATTGFSYSANDEARKTGPGLLDGLKQLFK